MAAANDDGVPIVQLEHETSESKCVAPSFEGLLLCAMLLEFACTKQAPGALGGVRGMLEVIRPYLRAEWCDRLDDTAEAATNVEPGGALANYEELMELLDDVFSGTRYGKSFQHSSP